MNDRPRYVPPGTPPPISGFESLWPGVNQGTALPVPGAQGQPRAPLTPEQERAAAGSRWRTIASFMLFFGIAVPFGLGAIALAYSPHNKLDAIIPGVIALATLFGIQKMRRTARRLRRML
jgi:hypothetical protein